MSAFLKKYFFYFMSLTLYECLNSIFIIDWKQMFLYSCGKKTEKIIESIVPPVIPYNNSSLGTTTPTLSKLGIFPQKKLSVKN